MAALSVLPAKPPQAAPRPVIRRAVPRDIPALIELRRAMAVADGTAALCDATPDDWARHGFGPAARFHVVVAEEHDALIGMASFNEQVFAGWSAPVVYLQDVFVWPERRRGGVGRALIERVALEAEQCKARLVYLNVESGNPACSLYRDLGFAMSQHCQVQVLLGPALTTLARRSLVSPASTASE